MNKLIPILVICLSTVFVTRVSLAANTGLVESIFEMATKCQSLTASSDDTQGDQSEASSEEDEEPDCE